MVTTVDLTVNDRDHSRGKLSLWANYKKPGGSIVGEKKFLRIAVAKNNIPPGSSDYAPKKGTSCQGDGRTDGRMPDGGGGETLPAPVNEVVGWERLQLGVGLSLGG